MTGYQKILQKLLFSPTCSILAVVYLTGASFALLYEQIGSMVFFSALVAGNVFSILVTRKQRLSDATMRSHQISDTLQRDYLELPTLAVRN